MSNLPIVCNYSILVDTLYSSSSAYVFKSLLPRKSTHKKFPKIDKIQNHLFLSQLLLYLDCWQKGLAKYRKFQMQNCSIHMVAYCIFVYCLFHISLLINSKHTIVYKKHLRTVEFVDKLQANKTSI